MGFWQLHRQGWIVPREEIPWTLAGVWSVVSAVKDAIKLEPPYVWIITVPLWVARRLEKGFVIVGLFMSAYIGIVVLLLVLLMWFVKPQTSNSP